MKKQVEKKIYLRILTSVLIVAIVAIGLLVFNQVVRAARERERLNSVSTDLQIIYDKFIYKYDSNIESKSFKNVCHEASVKYGTGRISCGQEVAIVLGRAGINQLIDEFIAEIRESDVNFSISDEVLEDQTGTGYRVSLIPAKHIKTGVFCNFSVQLEGVSDIVEYGMSCSDHVSDFIPGYERSN